MRKPIILSIILIYFAILTACDLPNNGCGIAPPPDAIPVTGPITGGQGVPQSASVLNLAARGYVEEEFFFEGQATGYELVGEMSQDGKWTVREADKAPFKTRLLVRRPVEAGQFNGTVVIEWLNVSAGTDSAPGWMFNNAEIMREGYAYVGISAQAVGVQGGGFAMAAAALPLKDFDPARYGSLNHPGDSYAFDIFTKAAQIVHGKGTSDVLGGLTPQRLLAYGESQSAAAMTTYTDAVQPVAKEFDGIFIHSRAASGMPLGPSGGCSAISSFLGMGAAVHIRTDLDVPVFQFQTETDVSMFYPARQPDTNRIRTWEVAGTAHADAYLATYYPENVEQGGAPMPDGADELNCENVNEGPQYIVLRAALHALDQWVRNGTAPPTAEPIEMTGAAISRDENDNALGGVRTPHVDVPISTLRPQKVDLSMGCDAVMCALFGATEPFSADKLLTLYPTHADYIAKYTASATQAADDGFILEPELQKIIAEANAAPIPF